MPRSLSNLEYVTFLDDVQPDTLGLPDWGGIAQWGGLYVLMFKMPNGEWALSDITGGIPYGGVTIDVATYMKSVPSTQLSGVGVFIYSIPANFMAVAAEYAADAGALATSTAQISGATITSLLGPLISGAVGPLAPILIAALVILAVIYVPKPR